MAGVPLHPTRRVWSVGLASGLTALLILAMAGCGPVVEAEVLAGRETPLVVAIWQRDVPEPVLVRAEGVRQIGGRLEGAAFGSCRIRYPVSDGVLLVAVDAGEYRAAGGGTLSLDSEVRLSGVRGGEPVLGRAAGAEIDRSDGSLVLREVTLWGLGTQMNTATLRLRPGAGVGEGSQLRVRPAPPAIAACLASLPLPVMAPDWQREQQR